MFLFEILNYCRLLKVKVKTLVKILVKIVINVLIVPKNLKSSTANATADLIDKESGDKITGTMLRIVPETYSETGEKTI